MTILLEDFGGLNPGMNVSADIIIRPERKRPVRPVEAVDSSGRRAGGRRGPRLSEDGTAVVDLSKAERREVTLGAGDEDYVEILSGLEEGRTGAGARPVRRGRSDGHGRLTAVEHLIELKQVYKIYQMGEDTVHALDGVDLTIDKGEFVAIVGSSGSGKSTAMNIIGCLDVPTAGTYRLGGVDVSHHGRRPAGGDPQQDAGLHLPAVQT